MLLPDSGDILIYYVAMQLVHKNEETELPQ